MALTSAVIKDGATALTVVGGSDMTFTPDGTIVSGGIHLANAAQTDFRVRENMICRVKMPTLLSDGTYSKCKTSVTYLEPMLLVSGKTTFNLIRIEREVHPEAVAAVGTNLNMMAGQILSDSDFLNFWVAGSLA